MAQGNAEPSMEDILSSIKRIIAEDSETTLSAPRVKRSVALTPMSAPVELQSVDEDDADVLELTDPVAVAEPNHETEEPVMPAAQVDDATTAAAPPGTKPVLVSEETAEASRSSLAALSALIVKPEIAGSDTLEGLVREMLRPMLADWLDANLPQVVERQVAQEIARITARG